MTSDARERALDLLNVSRETIARLDVLEREVRRWQKSVQLVSAADLSELWWRHIADSGQLLRLAPTAARLWVDIGSGGGFPAVVLAIMSDARPDSHFHLIESDKRKAAFLRHVSRETSAPVTVHDQRAERVIPNFSEVHVVTSRATASLSQLVAWADPLLKKGALGLFPKGENVRVELTELERTRKMKIKLEPSLTHNSASIVMVQSLCP